MDIELGEALIAELEAAADPSVRAVVVTGTGSSFSAGVDLFRVIKDGPTYGQRFLPLLDAMLRHALTFPKPMVTAVNGHAIAGGCILAATCDRRIMADGTGRIGIPGWRSACLSRAAAADHGGPMSDGALRDPCSPAGRSWWTSAGARLDRRSARPTRCSIARSPWPRGWRQSGGRLRADEGGVHRANPRSHVPTRRPQRPRRRGVDAAAHHDTIRAYLERTVGKK
jgi:hypothetical protein